MWLPIVGGLLFIILMGMRTTKEKNIKIVQRFGKYRRTLKPGLSWVVPFIDKVAGVLSLRVRQIDTKIETKTKDNVFVKLKVSTQFFIREESARDAFYQLENEEGQIEAYIFDIVRAEVPKLELDSVFDQKDHIAGEIKKSLSEQMQKFGFTILQALITEIDPDSKVKEAMNEINAQRRQKEALIEKAEGLKQQAIKAAEAEAESKALQGDGIARQRQNIINGLRFSLETIKESGLNEQEAMQMVLVTQYFDTLTQIGSNKESTTIFVPSSPAAISDIASQIRQGILEGKHAT